MCNNANIDGSIDELGNELESIAIALSGLEYEDESDDSVQSLEETNREELDSLIADDFEKFLKISSIEVAPQTEKEYTR